MCLISRFLDLAPTQEQTGVGSDGNVLVHQQKFAAFIWRSSEIQSTAKQLKQEICSLKQDAEINGVDVAILTISSGQSRFPAETGVKTIDSIVDYATRPRLRWSTNQTASSTSRNYQLPGHQTARRLNFESRYSN